MSIPVWAASLWLASTSVRSISSGSTGDFCWWLLLPLPDKCRLQFVILDRSLRLGASRLIFSKSAGEMFLDVLICSLSDLGILMGMRMLFILRPAVDIQVWSFKFSEFWIFLQTLSKWHSMRFFFLHWRNNITNLKVWAFFHLLTHLLWNKKKPAFMITPDAPASAPSYFLTIFSSTTSKSSLLSEARPGCSWAFPGTDCRLPPEQPSRLRPFFEDDVLLCLLRSFAFEDSPDVGVLDLTQLSMIQII